MPKGKFRLLGYPQPGAPERFRPAAGQPPMLTAFVLRTCNVTTTRDSPGPS
jgi:hypothetical protein